MLHATLIKITIFGDEATSDLVGFHVGPLSLSKWNLEFAKERKTLGSGREPTVNWQGGVLKIMTVSYGEAPPETGTFFGL